MLIISPESACDICLDQYSNQEKEPASLRCGHTFCRSCIYTLTVRVCPVCREPFNVTTDMRKLHCDYSDAKSAQILTHEHHALKACRSADILSVEASIMVIEDWLQTQPPGFRCSLPTVVELMRLLAEATTQLHSALQNAHSDEETMKQQKELQAMKWSIEKRRLEQENAALKEGISRQRDHLAFLEAEISKLRIDGHSVSSVQIIEDEPKRRSRPLPRHAVTTLPSPTSPPSALPTPVILSSPPPLSLAPISTSVEKVKVPNPSPGQGVTLMDTPISTTSPMRPPRPPRVGMGPRARTSVVINSPPSMPPPGAAPSAFMPTTPRHYSASQISHEPSQSATHDSQRRTSLPPIKRPDPIGAQSFDARKQRYSAQPSSWKPDFIVEPSLNSTEGDGQDNPSSPFRPLSESSSGPRPLRSPAPTSESPSLSRKRALRRSSKDYST